MSPAATPLPEKPPRPRRRWPVSLKLFAIVLAIGGTASVAVIGPRAYWNCRAGRTIERVGGRFDRKPQGLDSLRKRIGDDWLIPFDEITTVNLRGSRLTDAELVHLSGLQNLKSLDLSGTKVTDAGMAQLAKLTNLEHLDLASTEITDS